MRHHAKVAVSIPRELLAEIERMRKESGDSRSAVFERALSAYVAAADGTAKAQRYLAAYRRRPERVGEQRAALVTALEALSAEPWDA
jgi:hypothetical protein